MSTASSSQQVYAFTLAEELEDQKKWIFSPADIQQAFKNQKRMLVSTINFVENLFREAGYRLITTEPVADMIEITFSKDSETLNVGNSFIGDEGGIEEVTVTALPYDEF